MAPLAQNPYAAGSFVSPSPGKSVSEEKWFTGFPSGNAQQRM